MLPKWGAKSHYEFLCRGGWYTGSIHRESSSMWSQEFLTNWTTRVSTKNISSNTPKYQVRIHPPNGRQILQTFSRRKITKLKCSTTTYSRYKCILTIMVSSASFHDVVYLTVWQYSISEQNVCGVCHFALLAPQQGGYCQYEPQCVKAWMGLHLSSTNNLPSHRWPEQEVGSVWWDKLLTGRIYYGSTMQCTMASYLRFYHTLLGQEMLWGCCSKCSNVKHDGWLIQVFITPCWVKIIICSVAMQRPKCEILWWRTNSGFGVIPQYTTANCLVSPAEAI